MVAEAKPGEEVTLKIIRGDEEKEVDVTLGRWRGHDIFKDFALGPWKHSHRYSFLDDEYPYIGVKLLNISGDLASNLGAEDHGVLIDRVTDDSPAETAGLKAGDVIVSVDNEAVYDVRDVQQSIRRLDEGEVTSIHIVRNRKQMTVEIEVTLQEDRAFSGEPSSFRWIDLPPFRFWAPKMKGLHHGLDLDLDEFDSEESYDDMEELQEEFKELKKELRELKKSLQ